MPSESKFDDESEGKESYSEGKESEGCSKTELVEKVSCAILSMYRYLAEYPLADTILCR